MTKAKVVVGVCRDVPYVFARGEGGRTMWKNVRGWGGRWSLALWRCFHHERHKVGFCFLTGKNYDGICTPNEMALFKLEISLRSRYEWWLLSWFFQRPSMMACSCVLDILGVREWVKRTQSFAPSKYLLELGTGYPDQLYMNYVRLFPVIHNFLASCISYNIFIKLVSIYAYDSCI